MAENTFIGTELKFKVEIQASGFSMDDDDFSVEVRRGSKSILIEKDDMIHNQDGYFITIDTAALGTGKYDLITRAYVPDDDFDDGLRTEVTKHTVINVVKL